MSSSARPIVLRVETAIIHPIAARPGDHFIIQPGTATPVTLVREAPPNYGALLGHLMSGALSPRDDADETHSQLVELSQFSERRSA